MEHMTNQQRFNAFIEKKPSIEGVHKEMHDATSEHYGFVERQQAAEEGVYRFELDYDDEQDFLRQMDEQDGYRYKVTHLLLNDLMHVFSHGAEGEFRLDLNPQHSIDRMWLNTCNGRVEAILYHGTEGLIQMITDSEPAVDDSDFVVEELVCIAEYLYRKFRGKTEVPISGLQT